MSTEQPVRRGVPNQPPDPNTRRPKIAVPAMAWDTHIHLFGPRTQFPFEASSPYVSEDALPADYLRMAGVLGIKRAVIVSAGGYGKNYGHIRHMLERYPDQFRGIVLPRDDITALDVAELHALGVRGVRMFGGPAGHEWSHLPQVDARIAALAHEAGWHVQYHSLVWGEIVDSAPRLLDLPGRIVLDHFGMFDARLGLEQPAFRTILDLLDTGRVWVKLSAPMRCSRYELLPYRLITPIARALVAHAPERLLWGSDWPHVQQNERPMPNDGDLLDLLGAWAPDEKTRARILAENPLELYA